MHAIAKEAGVHTATVKNACENFIAYGTPSKPRGLQGRHRRNIPAEIYEFIVSDQGLHDMRFMGLHNRCQVLWQKFAFKIDSHSLRNIYKRAGIGYRFSRPQARKYLQPGTS